MFFLFHHHSPFKAFSKVSRSKEEVTRETRIVGSCVRSCLFPPPPPLFFFFLKIKQIFFYSLSILFFLFHCFSFHNHIIIPLSKPFQREGGGRGYNRNIPKITFFCSLPPTSATKTKQKIYKKGKFWCRRGVCGVGCVFCEKERKVFLSRDRMAFVRGARYASSLVFKKHGKPANVIGFVFLFLFLFLFLFYFLCFVYFVLFFLFCLFVCVVLWCFVIRLLLM